MAIMKKVQSFSQGIPHTTQSQDTTPRRIMLDINMLFWTVLQDADSRLNVDAFTDPCVALESFRPGSYDLLLIDVAMPKMDGFELYYKIRELDESQNMLLNSRGNVSQGNQRSISRARCRLLY
jgi:CheY-like chemotaxis protein